MAFGNASAICCKSSPVKPPMMGGDGHEFQLIGQVGLTSHWKSFNQEGFVEVGNTKRLREWSRGSETKKSSPGWMTLDKRCCGPGTDLEQVWLWPQPNVSRDVD